VRRQQQRNDADQPTDGDGHGGAASVDDDERGDDDDDDDDDASGGISNSNESGNDVRDEGDDDDDDDDDADDNGEEEEEEGQPSEVVEPLRKAALMREQLNVLMIGFHEVTARVGDQRSVLRDAACVEVSRSFRGFEATASRSDSVQRRPRGGGSLRCHGGWASRG